MFSFFHPTLSSVLCRHAVLDSSINNTHFFSLVFRTVPFDSKRFERTIVSFNDLCRIFNLTIHTSLLSSLENCVSYMCGWFEWDFFFWKSSLNETICLMKRWAMSERHTELFTFSIIFHSSTSSSCRSWLNWNLFFFASSSSSPGPKYHL